MIASDILMAWVVPVAIVAIATLAGWVVEQLVIRWARSMARRLNHRRDSMLASAVRGHVTFWGFLLGVALAYDTLTTVYKGDVREPARSLFSATTITYVHQGLLALFLVSLTWMLAGAVTVIIAASSVTTARPVVSLVTNVTRFIVLVIGFLLVMSVFGVSITPWLTTLGVAGLAVSLALQATLTDLVSGMLLLATRQITIGDYVKLSTGEEGYISDITWRTTTIRQLSNNIVIVPNAKMTSSSLTNYHTTSQTTSVTIDLGVSYNSDLDLVERVTTEVAQDVMKTVQGGMSEFQPFVRFNALGDYSIKFTVIMQAREVTDQYLIKHEFIKRLRVRYREEGISIPYPIQTVQVRESSAAGSATPSYDSVNDSASHSANHSLNDSQPPSQPSQASANSSEASSR